VAISCASSHRALDLSFPEFTRYVRGLDSELATTLLVHYPTAAALAKVSVKRLAGLHYDGRHRVGEELAQALRDAARISVGRHHSEPYQLRIRYACEDIVRLQQRLRELEADIAQRLERHQVGKLLTTIDGIGAQTAACIIAELGDPARFGSLKALASYVGVIPRLRQSGKRRLSGRRMLPLGNARLRRALWMPTLSAIRVNLWLRTICDCGPQASAPRSRSSPPCTNSWRRSSVSRGAVSPSLYLGFFPQPLLRQGPR
jgi:transposase